MENLARNFHPYSLSRKPLNRPKNRSGWLILDIFRIFGIIEAEEEKIRGWRKRKRIPPYISSNQLKQPTPFCLYATLLTEYDKIGGR